MPFFSYNILYLGGKKFFSNMKRIQNIFKIFFASQNNLEK
jgi:hypothetical protein